ncbi:hypothetical protein QBC34DRAFT_263900, partial [Podospora aff. communis PSN243]
FADVFVIGITAVVWGMISVCSAAYYTKLLRHDVLRRWPALRNDLLSEGVMLTAIFLATLVCWPIMLIWDFCARCCAGRKPSRLCGSCHPCISDEAHKEETERR